jgi:hypothetical protein
MVEVKSLMLGLFLGILICGLGFASYNWSRTVPAPVTSATPYEEMQAKARANIDRIIAQKDAEEAAAEAERDSRPSNVLGGPGSTSSIAVGVWADPVYGCQYITGGGDAPQYTPRMQFISGLGLRQVCSPN